MTSSAEFQALFQQGKRIDRPSLIVLWRQAEGRRRAGVAVSRQIRDAVRRNRVRRRLREAYRLVRDAAPARAALVIVGKRRALDESFDQLTRELRGALEAIPGARSES